MEVLELDTSLPIPQTTEESVSCPVCGAAMMQADKLEESNHIFVWLECSKRDCDGQWLQKKDSRFSS